MGDNREIRIKMTKIYPAACMLTGTTVKLTYHHCLTKKEYGGKETLANGALLNERIHCGFLHSVLEKKCPFCYDEINLLILKYKVAYLENDHTYLNWYYENVIPIFRHILETKYIIGKVKCKKRKRVKK